MLCPWGMSQNTEQLWKDALRKLMPYDGPWPRPGAAPFSADAYFTNPDARLRPKQPLLALANAPLYFRDGQDKVEVTPFNFPALHTQFTLMQWKAGLTEPYKLYIGRDVPSKASILKHGDRREIKLDLGILNRSDWSSVQFWLGHELGHAWQYANPEPRIPMRDPRVEPKQQYEVSADIFSMCLATDRGGILRGMSRLSVHNSESHPGREIRQDSVKAATHGDCQIFGLWPPVPPLLQARPKQR